MPRYKVIAEFEDLVAKRRRRPGDVLEVTEDRAAKLRAIGVIGTVPVADAPKATEQPKQTEPPSGADPGGRADENQTPADLSPDGGGTDGIQPGQDPRYTELGSGWYRLSNGEKVHGRKALEAALAAMEAGQGGEQ